MFYDVFCCSSLVILLSGAGGNDHIRWIHCSSEKNVVCVIAIVVFSPLVFWLRTWDLNTCLKCHSGDHSKESNPYEVLHCNLNGFQFSSWVPISYPRSISVIDWPCSNLRKPKTEAKENAIVKNKKRKDKPTEKSDAAEGSSKTAKGRKSKWPVFFDVFQG